MNPLSGGARRAYTEALKLSARDRAALLEHLMRTLDSDPEVNAAWDAEVRRRIDEVERGDVKTIPWSVARKQVFARPRKKK